MANDYGFEAVFSRQVEALGAPGDLLVGISTSGNSRNVLAALETARSQGMVTVAFTGRVAAKWPRGPITSSSSLSTDTARIQEAHMLAGHMLCDWIELDWVHAQSRPRSFQKLQMGARIQAGMTRGTMNGSQGFPHLLSIP